MPVLPLSGYGPPNVISRTSVNPFGSPASLNPQLPLASTNPVAQLTSTPASRAGGTPSSSTLVVGQPTSQSGASDIASSFTSANQTGNSSSGSGSSILTTITSGAGSVIGCASGGSNSGSNGKCLSNLLGSLPQSDLLCQMIGAAQASAKRQADAAGDQLLGAANDLTSLAPLAAPLSVLQNAVNKINPGDLANCLGAQALKNKINGQFVAAQNALKAAQKGAQSGIANVFNGATAALGDFAGAGPCNGPSSSGLSSLLG